MNFFDLTFSLGDMIVIVGFLWQFFRYVRRLEIVEREMKEQKKIITDQWRQHIKPMSETIREWKGTSEIKGLIPQMKEDIEQIKSCVASISDGNKKRSS